jgi:hypothetical protein
MTQHATQALPCDMKSGVIFYVRQWCGGTLCLHLQGRRLILDRNKKGKTDHG